MSKEFEEKKKRHTSIGEALSGISHSSIANSLYKELSDTNQIVSLHQTLASPALLGKSSSDVITVSAGLLADSSDAGPASRPNSSRANDTSPRERALNPENENIEQLGKIISSIVRLKIDNLMSVIKSQETTVLRHRDHIAKLETILGRKDEDIASLESQILNLKKNAGKDGTGFATQMELYTSIESNFSLRVNELLERNIALHAENVKLKEHINTMKERVHLANQNVDRVERKAFFDRYAVLHCQNVLKDFRISHSTLRSDFESLSAGIQQFMSSTEESLLAAIASADNAGVFKLKEVEYGSDTDRSQASKLNAAATKRKQSTFNFRLRDLESLTSRSKDPDGVSFNRKASVGFALGGRQKSVAVPRLSLAGGGGSTQLRLGKPSIPKLTLSSESHDGEGGGGLGGGMGGSAFKSSRYNLGVEDSRNRVAVSPGKRVSLQHAFTSDSPSGLSIPGITASPPSPMKEITRSFPKNESFNQADAKSPMSKPSSPPEFFRRTATDTTEASEEGPLKDHTVPAPQSVATLSQISAGVTQANEDTTSLPTELGTAAPSVGYAPLTDPALEQLRSHALQEIKARQHPQLRSSRNPNTITSIGVQTELSGTLLGSGWDGIAPISAAAATATTTTTTTRELLTTDFPFRPSASFSRVFHLYQRSIIQPTFQPSSTTAATTATNLDVVGDTRRLFHREDLVHLSGGFRSSHKYTIQPLSPDDPARIFQRLSVNMREYVRLMNQTFSVMPFTTSTSVKPGVTVLEVQSKLTTSSTLPFSPTRRPKVSLDFAVPDTFGENKESYFRAQKKNSEFLREIITHSIKRPPPPTSGVPPSGIGYRPTSTASEPRNSKKTESSTKASPNGVAAAATTKSLGFEPDVLEKILRGEISNRPTAKESATMSTGGTPLSQNNYILREWLIGFCWHVHGLLVSRLGIGLRSHGLGFGSIATTTTTTTTGTVGTPSSQSPPAADSFKPHASRTASLFSNSSSPTSTTSTTTASAIASKAKATPQGGLGGATVVALTRETHTMTDQEVMKIIHIIYNLTLWALNTMDLYKESISRVDAAEDSQSDFYNESTSTST